MDGIETATKFIEKYFPNCLAAVLCGSVARGDATPTSDLDVLIIEREEIPFYRKTFEDFGWIIEVFVGSQKFNDEKIQHPKTNHAPSYLTSWAEGIVLKDHKNLAKNLQEKAAVILNQGPEELTKEEINHYRHVVKEWSDDFLDCKNYQESLFVVYELFAKTAELLLAYNKQWIGERKWLSRALQNSGLPMAERLISSLENFYRTGEKDPLIKATRSTLRMTQ